MSLEGLAGVQAKLAAAVAKMHAEAEAAADESAMLLEVYAKTHHGTRPREAGWVYPGGGHQVKVANMYFKKTDKAASRIGAGSYYQRTRRWREGGIGWGDVTGNTNNSIRGTSHVDASRNVRIVLSAGMQYNPDLETANKKRWQWLWPTVVEQQKNVISIFRRRLSV